jgi:hypothetical protein
MGGFLLWQLNLGGSSGSVGVFLLLSGARTEPPLEAERLPDR